MTDIELSAKKELLNYAHLIECVHSTQSKAMEIRSLASSVRASAGIAVSGGTNIPAGQRCLETLEQIAIRLDELSECCRDRVDQTLSVLFEIENGLHLRILCMRYIDWVTNGGRMPTWERMARELYYDASYIKHLHKAALREFYEIKTRLYPTRNMIQ